MDIKGNQLGVAVTNKLTKLPLLRGWPRHPLDPTETHAWKQHYANQSSNGTGVHARVHGLRDGMHERAALRGDGTHGSSKGVAPQNMGDGEPERRLRGEGASDGGASAGSNEGSERALRVRLGWLVRAPREAAREGESERRSASGTSARVRRGLPGGEGGLGHSRWPPCSCSSLATIRSDW